MDMPKCTLCGNKDKWFAMLEGEAICFNCIDVHYLTFHPEHYDQLKEECEHNAKLRSRESANRTAE